MSGPINIFELGPDDGRAKPGGNTPPAAPPPPAPLPPNTVTPPPDPTVVKPTPPAPQNQTAPDLPDEPPQWLAFLCAGNILMFWNILGWLVAAVIFVAVALPQFRAYKRAGRTWGDMPSRLRFLFATPIITVAVGIPCYYWLQNLSLSQLDH